VKAVRWGNNFVVFCFARPDDPEAFAERFGTVADGLPAVTLNTSGRPERVVQDKRKVQKRHLM